MCVPMSLALAFVWSYFKDNGEVVGFRGSASIEMNTGEPSFSVIRFSSQMPAVGLVISTESMNAGTF